MLFRWIFYSYGVFIHDEIKWIYGCEISKCHNLMVLCQAYLQKVVFENSPSDHETWSLWCHVRIHVHLTSILQSHTPLVPQVKCEANLDRLYIFHKPMRMLEMQSSQALSLFYEVVLTSKMNKYSVQKLNLNLLEKSPLQDSIFLNLYNYL